MEKSSISLSLSKLRNSHLGLKFRYMLLFGLVRFILFNGISTSMDYVMPKSKYFERNFNYIYFMHNFLLSE